jgi:hypothetical protein
MKRTVHLELEGMPHFDRSMNRVAAWYGNEIIDRPPVRFYRPRQEREQTTDPDKADEKLWFDTEYQVESFLSSIQGKHFNGETFPIFEPNLGPNVYAAMHGGRLEFGEDTSWYHPIVESPEELGRIHFSRENRYFRKLEEMTRYALERCQGKSLVAYPDLHPGVDCAAAWLGSDRMCIDIYDQPDLIRSLLKLGMEFFHEIYFHFDSMLKEANLPSVCWIPVPDFGTLHIPTNDFSAMVGTDFVRDFCIPVHREEMEGMTRNIFHLDGSGVARHLQEFMKLPNLSALHWAQGAGAAAPIMQWLPLVQQIRSQGIPLIVELTSSELEQFMEAMSPEGLFLWVEASNEEEEKEVLKRLLTWRG